MPTAINTPSPNLRNLVGKNEEWIKSKNSMTHDFTI
jgi:hypothetical protein